MKNKSPHRRLGDITPKEAFTGQNLEISHLRIIGCPIYIYVPRDTIVLGKQRRPTWARQTLQDVEGHVAPCPFWESKRLQRYGCYIALMRSLLDSELSTYEEACRHHCWRDDMTEEYESILKNDVWDIVPISIWKYVVTSKWIFKIKHVADGSIEKYKERLLARGFS